MESLRFERKYRTEAFHADIIQLIKCHPAAFTEAFYERQINNIYFDSPGFENYYDNVEGRANRWKYRIRWYGETFTHVADPVLEIKVKKGLMGYKHHYRLTPFTIKPGFSVKELDLSVNDPSKPFIDVLGKNLTPVLLNTYKRRYFISADKKFRITVDYDQIFYKLNKYNNLFLNKVKLNKGNTVIELKYDNEHEIEAKNIGMQLHFLLTKNSKYIEGIEKTSF